jgi:hypothetical protein
MDIGVWERICEGIGSHDGSFASWIHWCAGSMAQSRSEGLRSSGACGVYLRRLEIQGGTCASPGVQRPESLEKRGVPDPGWGRSCPSSAFSFHPGPQPTEWCQLQWGWILPALSTSSHTSVLRVTPRNDASPALWVSLNPVESQTHHHCVRHWSLGSPPILCWHEWQWGPGFSMGFTEVEKSLSKHFLPY